MEPPGPSQLALDSQDNCLPFDLLQPPLAIPRCLDLVPLAPQQIWDTLTEEQRSELRQQLIQTLQEVMRHAKQY